MQILGSSIGQTISHDTGETCLDIVLDTSGQLSETQLRQVLAVLERMVEVLGEDEEAKYNGLLM